MLIVPILVYNIAMVNIYHGSLKWDISGSSLSKLVPSCSFSHSKRPFFGAVNGVFRKLLNPASEVVILELVKFKRLPILLHGLECCNLRSADLHSLDFKYKRLFMKLFRTKCCFLSVFNSNFKSILLGFRYMTVRQTDRRTDCYTPTAPRWVPPPLEEGGPGNSSRTYPSCQSSGAEILFTWAQPAVFRQPSDNGEFFKRIDRSHLGKLQPIAVTDGPPPRGAGSPPYSDIHAAVTSVRFDFDSTAIRRPSYCLSQVVKVTVHRCLQSKELKYPTGCCTPVSEIASRRHPRSASLHHLSVPRHPLSTFGRQLKPVQLQVRRSGTLDRTVCETRLSAARHVARIVKTRRQTETGRAPPPLPYPPLPSLPLTSS